MTLITVNFQFNIANTPTTLPKVTVVVSGNPYANSAVSFSAQLE